MNFSNELVEVIKGSAYAEYEFSAIATADPKGAQLELEQALSDVIDPILDELNGPDYHTLSQRSAKRFLVLVLDELSTGSLIDTKWCAQQFIREEK